MGSLSNLVNHAAKGYVGVPEWATENSKPSVRDPPAEEAPKRASKKVVEESEEEDEDESDDEDDEDEDDDEVSQSHATGCSLLPLNPPPPLPSPV